MGPLGGLSFCNFTPGPALQVVSMSSSRGLEVAPWPVYHPFTRAHMCTHMCTHMPTSGWVSNSQFIPIHPNVLAWQGKQTNLLLYVSLFSKPLLPNKAFFAHGNILYLLCPTLLMTTEHLKCDWCQELKFKSCFILIRISTATKRDQHACQRET